MAKYRITPAIDYHAGAIWKLQKKTGSAWIAKLMHDEDIAWSTVAANVSRDELEKLLKHLEQK